LNGLNFQFGLTASSGVVRITTNSAEHYGFTAGGLINYKLSAGGMWTLGAEVQYAKFPGMNNNTFTVSLDPAIHF
jgi:hypothetical protein